MLILLPAEDAGWKEPAQDAWLAHHGEEESGWKESGWKEWAWLEDPGEEDPGEKAETSVDDDSWRGGSWREGSWQGGPWEENPVIDATTPAAAKAGIYVTTSDIDALIDAAAKAVSHDIDALNET